MKELKFVKFPGGYYIPRNVYTYKKLVEFGLPVTQLLEVTREALSLVLRKKKLGATFVNFRTVRVKFHAKLEELWSGKGLKVVTKNNVITLDARNGAITDPTLIDTAKKTISDFAQRWGLVNDVQISTTKKGRVKIYADLKPSKLITPVITVSVDVEAERKQELMLGTYKFSTLVQGKYLYWWLEVKAGPTFLPVKHGKCLQMEVQGQFDHFKSIMTTLGS